MIENKDFVQRLLKYKDVLSKLKSLGFVKVFSDNLVDAVGVSSSQVRKDFALLKISGNKRGGYKIDQLIGDLNEVLGKKKLQEVIIVGCGKIGAALMQYRRFDEEGIKIIAGFDTDTAKHNPEGETPIYPMEKIKEIVKARQVKVGIITVPHASATNVLDELMAAGIKGVLNFAPVSLRSTEKCIINSINIEHEIENIFYFVKMREKNTSA